MYLMLKHTHMMLVGLSLGLFLWRFLIIKACGKIPSKWFRLVPPIVDTLLLVSAVLLVSVVGYSWQSPWLLAKVIALVGYICFGILAMRGQGIVQWGGFCLACLFVAYIVMVAITKTPWAYF